MSRMHSGKKGKSGSKKPLLKKQPNWVRYKPKEIEMLVVKLSKEGKTPSTIGITLRDSYGIPDVELICKKKITKILDEHKLLKQVPEDLVALIKRYILIKKHLEKNTKDTTAKRGLQLAESKINRVVKYYKNKGKLPHDWRFDPKKASMFAV